MSRRDTLIAQIKRHEGLRLKPYYCTAGKLTVGYGRNLEDVGVDADEAEGMLRNDLARVENECLHVFPWFSELSEARQEVILNMCFNLGLAGLKKFTKFLKAVELGNYDTAADEMLESLWAKQVKSRALELASMMRGSAEA
ncbi:MAG: glycoside hydrolase family protein [Nitrospira sp.]|nr:glycoside hydrolase family protein [Nitrospira sp.]MDH5251957.1 glycoside hydrolase family protein [Nitrospira sp.]